LRVEQRQFCSGQPRLSDGAWQRCGHQPVFRDGERLLWQDGLSGDRMN